MSVDFGLSEHELGLIRDTLASFPEVGEGIIFGSRATGRFRRNSDIDIAVRSRPELEPRSENLDTRLFGMLDILPLPYSFDVIDCSRTGSPELLRKIETEGIVFYRRDRS